MRVSLGTAEEERSEKWGVRSGKFVHCVHRVVCGSRIRALVRWCVGVTNKIHSIAVLALPNNIVVWGAIERLHSERKLHGQFDVGARKKRHLFNVLDRV